jgi:hypothetical protein
MRRLQSDPPSLLITRWLALLVTGICTARGTWVLLQGISLTRNEHAPPGPAGPDFGPLVTVIGGSVILAVAASLSLVTLRTWRRRDPEPFDAAKACILVLALIAIRTTLAQLFSTKRNVLSVGMLAYCGLLVACAIAGIKAAIDLKRGRAQPHGFPVVPPPFPPALPDPDATDDLPADEH